jgi:hypothetical protein
MKKNVLRGLFFGAILFALLFFVYTVNFGNSLFLALFLLFLFIGENIVSKVEKEQALKFCDWIRALSIIALAMSGYEILAEFFHWYPLVMFKPLSILTLCISLLSLIFVDVSMKMINNREIKTVRGKIDEIMDEAIKG